MDQVISNLIRLLPKNLILKLGARGVVSIKQEKKTKGNDKTSAFVLPSFATNVVDSTGTGDALLSYATLSMIATKSLLISSILGSLAGACECEKDGNVVIQPDQIIKKINSIEDSSRYKIQSKK